MIVTTTHKNFTKTSYDGIETDLVSNLTDEQIIDFADTFRNSEIDDKIFLVRLMGLHELIAHLKIKQDWNNKTVKEFLTTIINKECET